MQLTSVTKREIHVFSKNPKEMFVLILFCSLEGLLCITGAVRGANIKFLEIVMKRPFFPFLYSLFFEDGNVSLRPNVGFMFQQSIEIITWF